MEPTWLFTGLAGLGGWILGEFGQFASAEVRRLRLKRSIVSELHQIIEETDRVWLAFARSLQIASLRGIDNNLPLPISGMVFASHYGGASLIFTRVQRTAMEMIHSYVTATNQRIAKVQSIVEEAGDISDRGESVEHHWKRYKSALRAAMMTARQTRWYAVYYLKHPDFPILEPEGEQSNEYRAYLDECEGELDRTEKSTSTLTIDDFRNSSQRARMHAAQAEAPDAQQPQK